MGVPLVAVVHGHPGLPRAIGSKPALGSAAKGAAEQPPALLAAPLPLLPSPSQPSFGPQPSPGSCTNPSAAEAMAVSPQRSAPALPRPRTPGPMAGPPAALPHGPQPCQPKMGAQVKCYQDTGRTVGLSHVRSSRGYRPPPPGPEQLWEAPGHLPWERRKGLSAPRPGQALAAPRGPSPLSSLTSPSVLLLSSEK